MSARLLALVSVVGLLAGPTRAEIDLSKFTKGIEKLVDSAKDATKVAKGVTGIGPQEERNIGDAIALEIIARYGGLERDPDTMHRVNVVGRALARYSDRPDLEWRFAVLASDTVNAFSAPGGYVFITRGLYERADSDAVLAGILGHEIAHITSRHALKIVERNGAAAGGRNLLLKRSSDARALDAKVQEVNSQLGVDLGALAKAIVETGFDAPTEFEADRLGRDLAANNGFAPGGLRAALQGLKRSGENRQTMFATHPPLADRLQRLPDDPAPPSEPARPKPLPGKLVAADLAAGESRPFLGQSVRALTVSGEGAWRQHETEVLLIGPANGVQVQFREGLVMLSPGEGLIIPRRREYRPVALDPVQVLVVAPTGEAFE